MRPLAFWHVIRTGTLEMWSVSYGMLKRMGNYILPVMLRRLFISATLSFGNLLDLVKNRNGFDIQVITDVLFVVQFFPILGHFVWIVERPWWVSGWVS